MTPPAPRHHDRHARFHHDPTARGPHGEWGVHAPLHGGMPPFGPGFGRRGRGRAGRGDIRAVLLSVLAEGPANGYTLIKTISARSGGSWRPSPGSVYPTLQQLVDEELIEASGEGRRTEYVLTASGRDYVAEHADELTRAWESGVPKRSEQELAFQQSVGKLMGVVGQFHHAASDDQRTAAAEKLDEARRALYLILAD